MSWAIGYDNSWQRDIGYGVPAYCDAPGCSEEIDRGLAYVCAGQQSYGGDTGCGLYFCSKHLFYGRPNGPHCKRCINSKPPYKRISQEHPRWVEWKMTDESWADWRRENGIEKPLDGLLEEEAG